LANFNNRLGLNFSETQIKKMQDLHKAAQEQQDLQQVLPPQQQQQQQQQEKK
jgi:hypothetical protein